MVKKFIIHKNRYLSVSVHGYHSLYYTGFNTDGNPDFLNTLKNTFNNTQVAVLNTAREEVEKILLNDIPLIMQEKHLEECSIVCVPRAKALTSYSGKQLLFQDAVSNAASKIKGAIDASRSITRTVNTKTTHLKNSQNIENDGDLPYPGITSKTCTIDLDNIKGKDIILVDDIYTVSADVDEDCIQFLLNHGARTVIFYAVAYTNRLASNLHDDTPF